MTKVSLQETPGATDMDTSLKIAVEGCGHGELDYIYEALDSACKSRDWTLNDLDFLIICGDFQAMRNTRDLNCMASPARFRKMGDFHKYYSGEKTAPVLTIVVGGNHEASNYFSELYLGGWLAPNIYYVGDANVIRYGPYRIAGLSGIYQHSDYFKPRNERLPYTQNEIRQIYHVRESDVAKLLQISTPIDICLSHDWPRRVEWFGDYKRLVAARSDWLVSIKADKFGSAPAEQIMNVLRPNWFFSGHMHLFHEAVINHDSYHDIFKDVEVSEEFRKDIPASMLTAASTLKNTSKITTPPAITNTTTKFLGLDKPLPGNTKFLETLIVSSDSNQHFSHNQYMERTPEGKFQLHYDEEWLQILKSEDLKASNSIAADLGSASDAGNSSWVHDHITAKGLLKIPRNFEKHAPVHDPNATENIKQQPPEYPNSQTEKFCNMLGIRNRFVVAESTDGEGDFVVFE
jgi:lariat debranching enzyme